MKKSLRRKTSLSAAAMAVVLLLQASNLSGMVWYHRMMVLVAQLSEEASTSSKGSGLAADGADGGGRRLMNDSVPRAIEDAGGAGDANPGPQPELPSYTGGINGTSAYGPNLPLPSSPQPHLPIPANLPPMRRLPMHNQRQESLVEHQTDLNTRAPRGSPYEQRWPDFYLPGWAQKWLKVPQFFVPGNRRVCYVHVGKTAGSTIGCALGFRLHCHGDRWHPAGWLPHYATNMLHSNVNDCPLDAAYYLVTLRDPVERIKSWFLYEQAALAPLREECPFETLQDLAIKGLQKSSKEASQKCQARAKRAIRGEQRFGYHNAHHYGYHMAQIPFNGSIAAIRSEHMVQDWNSMEALLGGDARVEQFPRKNVGESHSVRGHDARYLSPEARQLVCFYLCEEIQVYKQYLRRAVNLTPDDIEQSMSELRASCPDEADASACPYYELHVDLPSNDGSGTDLVKDESRTRPDGLPRD